jgi:hypothetical protein
MHSVDGSSASASAESTNVNFIVRLVLTRHLMKNTPAEF